MGTTWSVKAHPVPPEVTADDLRESVRVRLEELEQQMSTWREDSAVSRFNASDSTNWFAVPRETALVVTAALTVARQTGGAFDPTVLPLVSRWGFSAGRPPTSIPAAAELRRIRDSVGYQRLAVRAEPPALRKAVPGLQIDLSAIAKGQAVDEVAALLAARGLTNHLVEIGGELVARGLSPKGRPWRVGIEKPVPEVREIAEVVELRGEALATSGDYRNYFELEGRRLAHLIDPRTGEPLPQRGLAVSVRHPSCMIADAWATGLSVLGVEAGIAAAREHGLAAQFLMFEDGRLRSARHAWPAAAAGAVKN